MPDDQTFGWSSPSGWRPSCRSPSTTASACRPAARSLTVVRRTVHPPHVAPLRAGGDGRPRGVRPQSGLDGVDVRAAARRAGLGGRGDRTAHGGARRLDVPQPWPEHHRHRRHQTRAHADSERSVPLRPPSVLRHLRLRVRRQRPRTANWFIASTGFAVLTLLVVWTATEEGKLVERFGDD